MKPSLLTLCLATAVTAVSVSTGCAKHDRVLRFSVITDTHLIFNPECNSFPSEDIGRTDWPVTHVYETTGEFVDYEIIMIDRQTNSGRGRDRLIRTFRSTRRGHARR